jgi:uncharacterized protein (DUF488 family)
LKENLLKKIYTLGTDRRSEEDFIEILLAYDIKSLIDLLESIAETKTSVIVCAERFPWKCHRKWISRELHKRGWRVEHIIDKGKVWIPK